MKHCIVMHNLISIAITDFFMTNLVNISQLDTVKFRYF